MKELAEDGKWCAESQVFEPTRCYRLIYGSTISVTKVDRKEGLAKLKKEADPKGLRSKARVKRDAKQQDDAK
jgi:hypothetical protein